MIYHFIYLLPIQHIFQYIKSNVRRVHLTNLRGVIWTVHAKAHK